MTCARFPVNVPGRSARLVVPCAENVNRILDRAFGAGHTEQIAHRQGNRFKTNELGIDNDTNCVFRSFLLCKETEKITRPDAIRSRSVDASATGH